MFVDGAWVESREYVAGFWVIDAADSTMARSLAVEGSRVCDRKVELRAFNAPRASSGPPA